MTELLPCPYCGNDPIFDRHAPTPGEDDSFVVIRCGSCGFSKEYNFESKAIKWWNGRAPQPLIPAQSMSDCDANRMRRAILKYLSVFDACGGSESVDAEEFAAARHGLRESVAEVPSPAPSSWQPTVSPMAMAALEHYRQADEDGEMVTVSRQALDEAIAALSAATFGSPPNLPKNWTQEHAAKAAWMVNTLAITPTDEWRSKAELFETFAEFRALSENVEPSVSLPSTKSGGAA